jgi:hypothetical protein
MNFWSFCLSLKAEIKGMHYHKAFCLIFHFFFTV